MRFVIGVVLVLISSGMLLYLWFDPSSSILPLGMKFTLSGFALLPLAFLPTMFEEF